jgi:YD repeat-containing protein
MWSVRDIDLASERFDGLGSVAVVSEFKDAHTQAPVKSELRADIPQPVKANGRHPCLIIRWPDSAASRKITAEITKCLPRSLLETEVNEIEVDLRYGLVLARNTDLFIPDAIPLALTRCYRLWDRRPLPFGAGTNHVWDMNPTGSRQPYTYIDLALCDGQSIHYDRISKGSGYADAVYEHRETSTPFFGSRFSWNGNGWDLRLQDGSLLLFPEAYYAKRPVDGAIVGFRDAEGRSVRVDRDRHRNLQRITSPSGHFIAFEQNPSGKILKAFDDRERTIEYVYDDAGRLALIKGKNSLRRHRYDGTYLTAIADGERPLVDLQYFEGRLAKLSLPDGRSYHFRFEYDPSDDRRVVRSFTTEPAGTIVTTDVKSGTN